MVLELTGTSRIYLICIAVSFIISTSVSYWVYTLKNNSKSKRLFMLTASLNLTLIVSSVYAFVYSTRLSLFLYYINSLSQLLLPLAWYLFSTEYIKNNTETFTATVKTVTYTYLSFVALFATNELHNLFGKIVFVSHKSLRYPTIEQTVFIDFFIIIGFGLIAVTVYKLYTCFKQSRHRKTKHLTALLMISVTVLIVPFSITQFDLFELPLNQFDHSVFGTVGFFVAIAIAVTESGFLEIQPQAKEELFGQMDEGVLIFNMDGEITESNKISQTVFPEIETKKNISEITNWPFDDTLEKLTQTEHYKIEQTVNQEQRTFIVSFSHITQSDKPVGFFCLLKDITELEQTKQDLKERNEKLNQFSHTIAHDLRNPLNVASGYTEIIREDLQTVADENELDTIDIEKTLTYTDKIDDSFDRMESIIEDVLTMVDGKTIEDKNLKECTLKTVVEKAWTQVETESATLNIQPEAKTFTLYAEPSKLQTILENLFRNSIEHSDNPTVTIGVKEDGFFVADDGPGIPSDIEDSLFEYGVSKSDSGTGLGLSIVKTLAEAHTWDVSINTEYEDGAKFVFTQISEV